MFTGKVLNLQLAGNFICTKRVRDIILKSSSAKEHSKTDNNVQNTAIVNKSEDYGNAGQRSHKKVEHQFPDQFLSNILLVKKDSRKTTFSAKKI